MFLAENIVSKGDYVCIERSDRKERKKIKYSYDMKGLVEAV